MRQTDERTNEQSRNRNRLQNCNRCAVQGVPTCSCFMSQISDQSFNNINQAALWSNWVVQRLGLKNHSLIHQKRVSTEAHRKRNVEHRTIQHIAHTALSTCIMAYSAYGFVLCRLLRISSGKPCWSAVLAQYRTVVQPSMIDGSLPRKICIHINSNQCKLCRSTVWTRFGGEKAVTFCMCMLVSYNLYIYLMLCAPLS